MTQCVIDSLKFIEVYKKDGQSFATAVHSPQSLLQLLSKQNTVSQPCQSVVMGNIMNFRLRSLAFVNFSCQLLVGENKFGGAIRDATLKILVHLAERLICLMNRLFSSLSP